MIEINIYMNQWITPIITNTEIEGVKLYRSSDVASVLGYARPINVVRDKNHRPQQQRTKIIEHTREQ